MVVMWIQDGAGSVSCLHVFQNEQEGKSYFELEVDSEDLIMGDNDTLMAFDTENKVMSEYKIQVIPKTIRFV